MRYLLGHAVASHERLTCLVVPAEGEARPAGPDAGTPGLERHLRRTPRPADRDLDRRRRPLRRRGRRSCRSGARRSQSTTTSRRCTPSALRAAIPGSRADVGRRRRSPSCGCARTRTRSPRLLAVGAAIDRVQRRIGEWLRPGRTEREIAADIAAAIVEEGHAAADFVIVGSGPNGASPHHEASDRVIEAGELGGDRHRWSEPRRVLLRLHPHLPDRDPASDADRTTGRRGLRDREGRAGGRGRGGPAGRHRRVDRCRRPRGDRRRRVRRVLHHPHRPRHRSRGARAPVPGARQHDCRSSPAWRSPSSPASTCPACSGCGSRTS